MQSNPTQADQQQMCRCRRSARQTKGTNPPHFGHCISIHAGAGVANHTIVLPGPPLVQNVASLFCSDDSNGDGLLRHTRTKARGTGPHHPDGLDGASLRSLRRPMPRRCYRATGDALRDEAFSSITL